MEHKEHFSRKRTAILEVLKSTTCHPTADWVYGQLKPRYPDLSLGTVYRNLKRFCASGQASSVGVIAGYERFDGNAAPHTHLVCRQCGAVVDVCPLPLDPEELEKISALTGCRIESAAVTMKGLCAACVKAGKPA